MDSSSGPRGSDPTESGSGSGAAEDPPSPQPLAAAPESSAAPSLPPPSRYESQKTAYGNTFLQHLRNHKPAPIPLARCSGSHVLGFLNYLDQFGKTKVHVTTCPHFGCPDPPSPCACPLRQAWGSLDALIGRLRAAYEENGGSADSNPFASRAVQTHLREVREAQAKARGIRYEKKKRKRNLFLPAPPPPPHDEAAGSGSTPAVDPTIDTATTTSTAE